jgi:AraC family transcriptional regulator
LIDLALLALSDHVTSQTPVSDESAILKVERAIAWFTENLGRKPSAREVADAVHISHSHLRRLFWEVRKASPKQVFQSIRLEKANELMSRSACTLDEVAASCGFSNASHLCREYKSAHHFSPTRWRKRLVASFAQPVPSNYAPVRQYSTRPADRMVSL